MENQHHHQAHFEGVLPLYYTQLKETYLNAVKSAKDKEYAQDYFRAVLFENNPAIPTKSIFFEELRGLFDHLHKLRGNSALPLVMGLLPEIRQKSQEALTTIERYCDGLVESDYFQLPDHYDVQLYCGAIPAEIIEEEKAALGLTDRQVVELLALYTTTCTLYDEFRARDGDIEAEPRQEDDKLHRFTRPQQVLVFHYMLEACGVKYNAVSIADCARLLHKLIGVPTPRNIMNSDLYKMLKKPTGKLDIRTMIDLRVILPFFERLPHHPIKDKINKHLSECNDDEKKKDSL